jgi:ubiquinone biosynthesis protein UbiJ
LPTALASLALALALAVSGCEPMDRAELKRGVETLTAIAVEGRLVADGVASDRSRSTYSRVHARALGEDTVHEAEKLADAQVARGIEQQREQAVELAQRLGDALEEIQVHPGRESAGEQVRDELRSVEDALTRLDARLEDVQ